MVRHERRARGLRATISPARRGGLRAVLLTAPLALLGGCGGARAAAVDPAAAAPAPVSAAAPVPAPVMATPAPAEVSVQVRETRAACGKEAAKQALEVIDFVTFNRLDENNWDTTIRARRRGRVVRVGCRYDLRAGWTYVYEPAAADGGNPWGASPPGATAAAGTTRPAATAPAGPASTPVTAGAPAKVDPPKAAPPKADPPKADPPKADPPKASPAKPTPGANIDLAAIPDASARSAIARTRDGCLAEAARRRIRFDDFDAFRRVDARSWEAQLVLRKGESKTRPCRFDLETGKATIK